MTLISAAQGRDYVIAACDSRGTFGHPNVAFSSFDMMVKLVYVSEHVVVLTAGAGEISDNLLDDFRRSLSEPIDGITTVVRQLQIYCLNKWNEWFENVPFQHRPNVSYLIAGLDQEGDNFCIPRIFSINSQVGFAPALHRYGWSHVGIPMYAVYLFSRRYRPNMDLRELGGLVAYAITETATQDLRVGGQIRMVKITCDGTQTLNDTDISALLEEYSSQG